MQLRGYPDQPVFVGTFLDWAPPGYAHGPPAAPITNSTTGEGGCLGGSVVHPQQRRGQALIFLPCETYHCNIILRSEEGEDVNVFRTLGLNQTKKEKAVFSLSDNAAKRSA